MGALLRPAGALIVALAVAASASAQFTPWPTNVGLKPQRLDAYGHVHYYQLQSEGPVTGTMVLIHGCGPGPRAFFPYDPVHCPECQGYPEYLGQTKQALARGYNVLALQANNAGSNCWSSSTRNGFVDDRPHVAATVAQFLRDHAATELPLYMQGYSSGGTMCLKLPAYLATADVALRIDGIVAVDAAPSGGFNAEDSNGRMKKGITFPPTLYVAMELGKARQRAPAQIEFLQNNGVPSDLVVSYPRPITPNYFSDRIPGITRAQSQQLVASYRQQGALDAEGNLLPGAWPLDAAAGQMPWLAGLLRDAVAMEMQISIGNHENMGEFTTASLAWLEAGGEADLPTLLAELVPARMADVTISRGLARPQVLAPGPAGEGPEYAPAAAPEPAPSSGAR